MSTTVSHKGSQRNVKDLPEANWLKHKDVIIAYCDGADVENRHGDRNWHGPIITPEWYPDHEYRIAQRKPQPGEVFYCEETKVALLITHECRFADLDTGTLYANYDGAKRAAPSVEAYYARKFLDVVRPEQMADEQAYHVHERLIHASKEASK